MPLVGIVGWEWGRGSVCRGVVVKGREGSNLYPTDHLSHPRHPHSITLFYLSFSFISELMVSLLWEVGRFWWRVSGWKGKVL